MIVGDRGAPPPAPGEPLIRVDGLWHTYMTGTPFEQIALRGVSIEAHAGEVVGIAGQTGSGKSTLIQYLNGLLRPARGRVHVGGHDLGRRDVDIDAVRRLVGVVFQDPEDQVFEPLVGDDVAYGPRQLGLKGDALRARVRWAMEAVGLSFEGFKDRYAFTLSGGELRRAALAGVLGLKPSVLVLDEPTSGLDPAGRDEVRALLARLREREGITLVIVSHDMEELARLCDRLYVLHDGRVVAGGTPRAVFAGADALVPFGILPPDAVQICRRLREHGLAVSEDALSVEEAGDAIAAALRGRA